MEHSLGLQITGGPSGCPGGQAVSPPSLVPREDGARKLAGLLGTEAGPDLDATADRIFYYIPGPVSRRVARPSSQGAAVAVSVALRVPVLAFWGPGSSLSAWGESVQNQVRKETPPRPGELTWRKA